MTDIFIIENDAKVTFIDQPKQIKWTQWKTYSECNDEEKKEINLASYPKNCILFDRDLPGLTEEQIQHDYEGFKSMLNKRGINSFYSYRSPKGYHVLAPFKNLNEIDEDLRKEIRKYYISLFLSDPAKISDRGVVSLPGKPHFKNGVTYDIMENHEGENEVNLVVLEYCKQKVKEQSELLKKINSDDNFNSYFETDNFFKYIKEHIIPENTNRDMTIFPNLAVAAVKSGKTKEEIDLIMKPIIKNNFPGKNYQEFEGWLKKAIKGEVTDYNPIQINNWMKTYSTKKEGIYDLKPVPLEELELKKEYKYRFNFVWDKDIPSLKYNKIEWVIENWLPKGDICFIAGKAASFKTTICLHFGYSMAMGKLVFNKYKTIQSKVLYLNEENATPIITSMINRIKNGLDLVEPVDNICFSLLENLRLDSVKDLEELANFITNNKIDVVICDSLRRFIGFDENNATEMSRFFENLKLLRKMCPGLTILVLHHLKKENSQYKTDLRDMLRGSSDIVNSADSIIGISRKHGCNAFKIEHIKNRSGIEMSKRLVLMDVGEQNDKCYFYESDKELDETKIVTKPEKCAEEIMTYLVDNKIKEFSKTDIKDITDKYKPNTVVLALKTLKDEGSIQQVLEGKYTKYLRVFE